RDDAVEAGAVSIAMRHALLSALLFTATAQAANLIVTSETALSPPSISSAAGAQTGPSLAWYGNSIAATWIDTRSFSSIRIAQLDSSGRPKDVAARLAAPLSKARIAANGRGTPLSAMQDDGGPAYVGPAGTSGQSITGSLENLITNGTTYLAETSDPSNIYGTILDDRGETIATAQVRSPGGNGSAAFPIGADYHVIRAGLICGVNCDGAIQDAVIHADGTFEDYTLVPHVPLNNVLAAATTGREILLAWTDASGIALLELTPQLLFIARSHLEMQADKLFLTSDGHDFLLAWASNHSLHAARIAASGLTAGSAFSLEPRAPDGIVIAWSDGFNVYTRAGADIAALETAPAILASLGITPQQDVSVRDLPVWIEGEFRSLVASPRGTIAVAAPNHTLHAPVAATGAGSTIVVWLDWDASGTQRQIFAKVNDDAPFVISEGGSVTSADVVFDGASFVVAWTNGHMYETRVLPNGAPIGTAEIPASGAARFGTDVAITFVDGADTILYNRGGSTRPVTTNGGGLARPSMAFNDRGEAAIVWIEQQNEKNCLMDARQLDDGGFAVQSLYCTGAAIS